MATIATINVGTSANDGTGDVIRDAFIKVNNNFLNLNEDLDITTIYTNAKDFGAIGDGISNDAIFINNAINFAFNNGGGTVFIPEGEYKITTPIVLKDRVTILGEGGSTLLKNAVGYTQETISVVATYPLNKIFDGGVKNLSIDGNYSNGTYAEVTDAGIRVRADVENPNLNGNPDAFGEFKNLQITNIFITNCKIGIYVGKTTFVQRSYVFDKIHVQNCATAGLYLDDYCEYVTFSNCIFENSFDGVYDNGSSNITFLNCNISNNDNSGINLFTTGRNTSKKNILGCTINHNKFGVIVYGNTGTSGIFHSLCNISNCHFMANSRSGIYMFYGLNFNINGNVFSGNSEGNANNYPDIYLSVDVKNTIVSSNVFEKGVDTKECVSLNVKLTAVGLEKQYNQIQSNSYIGYDKTKTVVTYFPSTNAIDANTNIIDGYMEFWNLDGYPPAEIAANTKGNLNLSNIPFGTILINRGLENQQWMYMQSGSLGTNTGKFYRLDNRAAVSLGTPASATATGTFGEIRYDANYMYLCTATNTWKRSAIATW